MSSAARFEGSPIRRGIAVIVLMFVLVLGRGLLAHNPFARRAAAPAATGSTWSEDLAADRRFERSLVARGLAAILLIAFLILARALLS
jgi:hypothetical protein